MSGLVVSVCGACGWRGFPERLWCPACGDETDTETASAGAVEERTVVRTMPGRDLEAPVAVATILLEGGGRAVARLEGDGDDVDVTVDDGAPVARAGSRR